MIPQTKSYIVQTSHGAIAVEEAGLGDVPVVFIHGNSSCKGVFRHQMSGALAESHRLIAFDLPGHGLSKDASDPMRTYTRPGFADAVLELLHRLDVHSPVVVGWSLGGHIGIEMIPQFPGLRGLMIVGTPPIGRTEAPQGFLKSLHGALGRRRRLSPTEVADFASAIAGEPVEAFLIGAITRADGRAREIMFEAHDAGAGVDQRHIVENYMVPLAVVNGENDALINLDFVDQVAYANLWDNHCFRIPGGGHAPFWNVPDSFNPILEQFVYDVGVPSRRRRLPREID